MDLQLHISEESFSAKAHEIVNDLKLLEKKTIGWFDSGNQYEREGLKKEVGRISPALGRLRLDCLCLSLSTGFQNRVCNKLLELQNYQKCQKQMECNL